MGYRKKVVTQNLKNAFPEKSKADLDHIRKAFYHYLCDVVLETVKTLTISPKTMLHHCSFDKGTIDLFNQLAADKKSVILVLGHQGNWEWAGNAFSLLFNQQLYVIYHPLSNPNFNNLIYQTRTRFGTKLIAMKDAFKDMIKNKDEVNVTAFIADQTPHPNNAYWLNFLNQDTPVFKGTEKIAEKLNYPIVYINVKKVKRGYYEVFGEMLIEHPKGMNEMVITAIHTKRLEKDIIEQPETWLWSHKRWKHKRA